MIREKQTRKKIKSPRFKDSFDEDLDWADRMDMISRGKKLKKKSQRRNSGKEKW